MWSETGYSAGGHCYTAQFSQQPALIIDIMNVFYRLRRARNPSRRQTGRRPGKTSEIPSCLIEGNVFCCVASGKG